MKKDQPCQAHFDPVASNRLLFIRETACNHCLKPLGCRVACYAAFLQQSLTDAPYKMVIIISAPFTDEETEAERGSATCLRFCS